MSRLQVGGLALVVDSEHADNIGKVVEIISYIGFHDSPWVVGAVFEYWEVKYNHRVKTMQTPTQCLLPLGDKQTQDELAKEKELEHSK